MPWSRFPERWFPTLCGPEAEIAVHWKQFLSIWIAFLVISGVSYHSSPVFAPSLMKTFRADQYEVSWLPACFQLAKGVFTLPGGFALHRFGVSRCIRWGGLLILGTTSCYPFVGDLGVLALLNAVNGLAYNLCGLAPVIVFVTSWFEKQRAFAIGAVVTAFSIAGVLFPPVLAVAIDSFGWRVAAGMLPVLMAMTLPLLYTILGDGPLLTSEVAAGHPAGRCPQSPLTFQRSLRTKAVWHMCFLSFYVLYIVIAFINTLVMYLKDDLGFPLEKCGFYTSVIFCASIAGKLLAGWASDLQMKRSVHLAGFLVLLLGTCLPMKIGAYGVLLPSDDHAQLLAFAVVYGVGFGSAFTVTTSMPAQVFGSMPGFGKLQGVLMLFQVLGGFLGTLLTTKLRIATGSYAASFSIFIVMALLCCLHCIAADAAVAKLGEDCQEQESGTACASRPTTLGDTSRNR